jgi:hypothetical protein
MRTTLILTAGFFLLGALLIFSRLFTEHFPAATSWATYGFLALWLFATGINFWVGVSKAGYSFSEELPIMLLLFGVPAVIAIVFKWKIL